MLAGIKSSRRPQFRVRQMSEDLHSNLCRARSCRQLLVGLLFVGGMLLAGSGCRGRAYDSVYQAKMAQRIRKLEDQLYQSEYDNRVLRDQMEQGIKVEDPYQDLPKSPAYQATEGVISEPPSGVPLADPMNQGVPTPVPDPKFQDVETGASQQGSGKPKVVADPDMLEPPRPDQLQESDPIVPGDVKPPATLDPPSPGNIPLPPIGDGSQATPDWRMPDHLELHETLSGGHHEDSDSVPEGLYLVITVKDEQDKIVNLQNFDIDAKMSVVMTEPAVDDQQAAAEIARWDFDAQQVRDFVRNSPVDGFHVLCDFRQQLPTGKKVQVDVQLSSGEEQMNCKGTVGLQQSIAASKWLPRG